MYEVHMKSGSKVTKVRSLAIKSTKVCVSDKQITCSREISILRDSREFLSPLPPQTT